MKRTALTAAIVFCFAGSCLLNAQEKAAPAAQKPADSSAKDAKKEESKSKLAGRWEGKITRQNGEELKLVYTFKVDGEKLTGSVESPMGELKIDEGKVKGDELSFKVEINGGVTEYQGKLSDGKIKMKSKGPR
ncbi:MAG: hypothetical protein ABSA26_14240, partial [Thermoguttaceae bacterium]